MNYTKGKPNVNFQKKSLNRTELEFHRLKVSGFISETFLLSVIWFLKKNDVIRIKLIIGFRIIENEISFYDFISEFLINDTNCNFCFWFGK
ncbi:hypothetical protein EMA8858_01559 [Emticicia aquatica]|uniref:Uncharacterized protein n=1 Tax=Emticicia aquatica TaxID=1681835 RepID=A0ABN8EWX4_9BACT|nr:hypothetical protein EMA8858_01559 [Emticicia aquatica]